MHYQIKGIGLAEVCDFIWGFEDFIWYFISILFSWCENKMLNNIPYMFTTCTAHSPLLHDLPDSTQCWALCLNSIHKAWQKQNLLCIYNELLLTHLRWEIEIPRIHKPQPFAYQYPRTPLNESNTISLWIVTETGYLDILVISHDEMSQRDWTETHEYDLDWGIVTHSSTSMIYVHLHNSVSLSFLYSPPFFHSIPSSSSNPHLTPFHPDSQ